MTNPTIDRARKFRRDYKREFKTHGTDLDTMFLEVMSFLINREPLPDKYQDHKLTGELGGHRSCHVKPDLLLVYEWPDTETLRLVRLGSHSKLYGL
jgi:mRNA interferase YafQ